MKIKKIPLEQINPAPYNPRKDLLPGDIEYEKLRRSMDEFGYIEPLVWNERTGNLVSGHQRYKILKGKEYTECSVSVVDLDEQQEKILNIALNKISGDWDERKLKELLTEIDHGLLDIELTGFDEKEIEGLLSQQYGPVDIDELLQELNVLEIIEKPIWATVRTDYKNKQTLNNTLSILSKKGIKVERSYE